MKKFFATILSALGIKSPNHSNNKSVQNPRITELIEKIKVDRTNDSELKKSVTKEDQYIPVLENGQLASIEIKVKGKLIFSYFVDPTSYQVVETMDWR